MTVHHQQISAEMTEHHQRIFTEMTAHYQRLEQCVDNNLSHICDSIRYMHACLGGICNRFDWTAPLPSERAQPLPPSGPPFAAWAPASSAPPTSTPPPTSPRTQTLTPFDDVKKGERFLGVISGLCYFGHVLCISFLGCLSMLYLDISLLSVWTCGHVLCFWF